MYRQLLMVLMGFECPLLSSEEGWKTLDKYMQPTEKQLVKPILQIASYYSQLKLFVESYKNCTSSSYNSVGESDSDDTTINSDDGTTLSADLKPGFYLEAFCHGMKNVFEDYMKTLLEAEKIINLNKDPVWALMQILGMLKTHEYLFLALISAKETIVSKKLHGCQILTLLEESYKNTFQGHHDLFLKIIRVVNKPFYDQLNRWVLYGQIEDEFQEFFIEKCDETVESNRNNTCDFHINSELLPSFFSPTVSQKILDIGVIVEKVLNDPRKSNFENRESFFKWRADVLKYQSKLSELEENIFDENAFQEKIENHFITSTEKLWKLVIKDGDLLKHLEIIREYVLLSRGEFYQEFLKLADSALQNQTGNITVDSLNKIFDTAWYNLHYTGEGPPSGFTFYYNSAGEHSVRNVICIKYSTPWPAQILFCNDEIIADYGKMFNFLLRTTYVQNKLNTLWLTLTKYSKKCDLPKNLYSLRNKCSSILNNLQNYLKIDVIESHYSAMIKTITHSINYQVVLNAHQTFVKSIINESFLNVEPIYLTLLLLISTIEQFWKTVNPWSMDEDLGLNIAQITQIDELDTKVNDTLHSLLSTLNTVDQDEVVQRRKFIESMHLNEFVNQLNLSFNDLTLT